MAVAGYRKKDYRRACDICGGAAWFSEMKYIGQNRWACDVDAPGLTAEQISRHNARVRPLVVKPHKHPKLRAEIPDYKITEALFFRLVCDNALTASLVGPTGAIATASTGLSVAQCGLYLGELILEAERPTSWIDQAKTKLRACADALIALQYGSPTGPSPSETITSVLYGAVVTATGFCQAHGNTLAGLAFLRAYRIFGETKYLDAADRTGHFLRTLQYPEASTAFSGGGGYRRCFMAYMTTAKGSVVSRFTGDALAMWFLAELRTIRGGAAVYGCTTAGGDWTSPPAASLATMLSDARSFYVEGYLSGWSTAPSSGTYGLLAPLSSATPRHQYDTSTSLFSLLADGGGGGSPQTSISASSVGGFALGLRGLYEYEGYSSTVAGIFEWLMSFTSNPNLEPAANATPYSIATSQLGVYDPTVTLATLLRVQDEAGAVIKTNGPLTTTVGAPTLSIPTGAWLAPLYVASGRDTAALKREIGTARKVVPAAFLSPGATVQSPALANVNPGLSFQVKPTSVAAQSVGVGPSAVTANVYRYAPKTYPDLKAG